MRTQLIKQILKESRSGLLNYLRQQLPNWPEYVIKDFAYAELKDGSEPQIKEFIEYHKDIPWKLEHNLFIRKDMFAELTIDIMNQRKGGRENPYNIPRDKERHEYQRQQIIELGLPTEPIIMFKNSNGKYELLEGWHRTIQLIELFPEGIEYPNVWLGIEPH